MRNAARTDANHDLICQALRSIGVTVEYLKLPLDLLICHRGETMLMEIKTETGRLTKDQVAFIARWPGKVHVVRNEREAIEAVLGKGAIGGCNHYEPSSNSDVCRRCNGTRFSHGRT